MWFILIFTLNFPLTDPQNKSWLFNPELIYDCPVIRETRTNPLPEKIQTIDNEQHDSQTDTWTVYVRTLYHHHLRLNVTYSFDYHVDCQIQRNHLNLYFSSYLSTKSRSMLPNLSLVMEFLGNIFTNFIFEKLLSHEALVKGRVTATATSNNQTQRLK